MVAAAYPRSFVPADFDAADFAEIEPLYQQLLGRAIESPAELEAWLKDVSELSSVVDELGTRRYIDMSCHTDDPEIEKRFLHYIEQIEPKVKPLFFALQRKFLESPHRAGLGGQRYEMLSRRWQADVDLFREENVPLDVETAKAAKEYNKTCGAMTVTYQGREYTLEQTAQFIEQPDRTVRQTVWELAMQRRLADRRKIDDIFDQLIELRGRIARNAGLPDFRAYIWKAYKRFDYTPEDCLRFADSIERVCVPLARKLDADRRRQLGVDRLRPFDLSVDLKGRSPLRPFDEARIEGLLDGTAAIFGRLSPDLAGDFDSLRRNKNLDLSSRKGKQPGGYQANLEESRQPFIFMNAAGLHRDVIVLLHEGGHAFHTILARGEPLMFLRGAPIEFCEVASMAMELLGGEHLDIFYKDPADLARAKRIQLERVIGVLPWIAVIDLFQHWLYTHPRHTRQQRTAKWLELMSRFERDVDWSGYEATLESRWQHQLHLFSHPFYYVEYGIAQLGALQLWLKSRQDPRQALANYRAALALGGTRPLPQLFAAAGIRFDFSEQTLRPLMEAVSAELESLPS
jgi:oligoendopeptidase F